MATYQNTISLDKLIKPHTFRTRVWVFSVCNHTQGIRRAELAACWHLHTQGIYLPEHLWCQMCVWIPTSFHTHALIYKNNEAPAQHGLLNFGLLSEWGECPTNNKNTGSVHPVEVLSSMTLNHLLQRCRSVGAKRQLFWARINKKNHKNLNIV